MIYISMLSEDDKRTSFTGVDVVAKLDPRTKKRWLLTDAEFEGIRFLAPDVRRKVLVACDHPIMCECDACCCFVEMVFGTPEPYDPDAFLDEERYYADDAFEAHKPGWREGYGYSAEYS
jgi:hypothetical protein